MQRLLLKNKICVWPSEELLEPLLPTKHGTLSCDASCVGMETEAPSERQQWGKRGGGGFAATFAARPFFSPLSQPTKVGLLDAPLTLSIHCLRSQVSWGGSGAEGRVSFPHPAAERLCEL